MNFRKSAGGAFSLIELMVAMGILSILLLMLTVLLDQVQKGWRFSESRVSQFREARVAFDLMAKNIGQASLNTYWDMIVDEEGTVERYAPTSELHFITLNRIETAVTSAKTQQPQGHAVFFQAPLGFSPKYRNLNNLFNGRGYFVAWGSDEKFKPSFVKSQSRYRYRLMEFRPPAESNQVFEDGQDERDAGVPEEFTEWYKQALNVGTGSFEDHLNPLAENIVAIIISPRDTIEDSVDSRRQNYSTIAPKYEYNSNDPQRVEDPNNLFSSYVQQVPPLIRLTMVAIDEGSAVRMENGSSIPDFVSEALGNRFRETANFETDIKDLSEVFDRRNVSYKVFSTMVLLRSAKWTES